MDHAKIASKIREKIHQFSGKLSAGLPKTARRLVREVVFGVQSRGSVRLSEIARSLEESASMKKVIERLGRQLQRTGLRRKVRENLLELAAGRVDSQTLLVLDPTDLSKPYAKKMQYLAPVRDGSEGRIRDGYWCCQVIGARRASAQVLPLYQELYSQEAPDFVSENDEILKAIQAVYRAVGGRGTWVIDRGGDRVKLLKRLMKLELSFLIRQRGDRHLRWGRRLMSVESIAAACRRRHRETVVKETPEGEKVYHLDFGSLTVRFPGFDQKLSLVVVDGFGPKPMMLLTTMKVTRSRKSQWRVIESYLARWRVEETIRFIKQSYRLEDIRLLSYEPLRSMAALVMAAACFACVHFGQERQTEKWGQVFSPKSCTRPAIRDGNCRAFGKNPPVRCPAVVADPNANRSKRVPNSCEAGQIRLQKLRIFRRRPTADWHRFGIVKETRFRKSRFLRWMQWTGLDAIDAKFLFFNRRPISQAGSRFRILGRRLESG